MSQSTKTPPYLTLILNPLPVTEVPVLLPMWSVHPCVLSGSSVRAKHAKSSACL